MGLPRYPYLPPPNKSAIIDVQHSFLRYLSRLGVRHGTAGDRERDGFLGLKKENSFVLITILGSGANKEEE